MSGKKAFDKAKWLDEKKAKIDGAKALLETGLAALQTSDEWIALLKSTARNIRRQLSATRYSFGNQMLLAMQREGVSSVGTFKTWQRYGRCVKKGEKGLMILTPKPWKREVEQTDGTTKERRGMSFGTAFVFDVSQTDGPPIEEPAPLCRDVEDAETFAHDVELLEEVARSMPEVSRVDIRKRLPGDPSREAQGWYCPGDLSIVVITEGVSRSHQFKTLVHEVAHALLHPKGDHHSRPEMEVEAESTAFIVCQVLGLPTDGYSFPYVAVWASRSSEKSTEIVSRSGDRIVKAATRILDALLGKVESPEVAAEEGEEVAA